MSQDSSYLYGSHHGGPTMIIDRCLSSHRLADMAEMGRMSRNSNLVPASFGDSNKQKMFLYGSTCFTTKKENTIRFQVVVWYVGPVDVLQGKTTMKFRVTLFWNDDKLDEDKFYEVNELEHNPEDKTYSQVEETSFWTMQGRHRAVKKTLSDHVGSTIDVPAVSILNAVSFDIVGDPEIYMLREKTKLMRWTCLYSATLLQENLRVDKFPHDSHDIILKLGILSNRRKGGRWEKGEWKLALATEDDSRGSTRIPHGLLVDHVKIPGFSHSKAKGIEFSFIPLEYGAESKTDEDMCLQVKLRVTRESSYYDNNIMPILGTLDIVATCILCQSADQFFQRGLMLLNIAFLEIGMRMTLDNHLPRVGYQIKLQSTLNQCFFRLLALVLESCFVYFLVKYKGIPEDIANKIDAITAMISLAYASVVWRIYYKDKHTVRSGMWYSR